MRYSDLILARGKPTRQFQRGPAQPSSEWIDVAAATALSELLRGLELTDVERAALDTVLQAYLIRPLYQIASGLSEEQLTYETAYQVGKDLAARGRVDALDIEEPSNELVGNRLNRVLDWIGAAYAGPKNPFRSVRYGPDDIRGSLIALQVGPRILSKLPLDRIKAVYQELARRFGLLDEPGMEMLLDRLLLEYVQSDPEAMNILQPILEEAKRSGVPISLFWDPDFRLEEGVDPAAGYEIMDQVEQAWRSTLEAPHGYYIGDDLDGAPMIVAHGYDEPSFEIRLDGTSVRLIKASSAGGIAVYKPADEESARAIKEHMTPIGLGQLGEGTAVVISRALNEANLTHVSGECGTGAPWEPTRNLELPMDEAVRHGYCGSLGIGTRTGQAIGGGTQWGSHGWRWTIPGLPKVLKAVAEARQSSGQEPAFDAVGWLQRMYPGVSPDVLDWMCRRKCDLSLSDLSYLTADEAARIEPILAADDLFSRVARAGLPVECVEQQLPYVLEGLEDAFYELPPDQALDLVVEELARSCRG